MSSRFLSDFSIGPGSVWFSGAVQLSLFVGVLGYSNSHLGYCGKRCLETRRKRWFLSVDWLVLATFTTNTGCVSWLDDNSTAVQVSSRVASFGKRQHHQCWVGRGCLRVSIVLTYRDCIALSDAIGRLPGGLWKQLYVLREIGQSFIQRSAEQ